MVFFIGILLSMFIVEYIYLFLFEEEVIKFFGFLNVNYIKSSMYRWNVNLFGIMEKIFVMIKMDIYRFLNGYCFDYL